MSNEDKPVSEADVWAMISIALRSLEKRRTPGGSLTKALLDTAHECRERESRARAALAKPDVPDVPWGPRDKVYHPIHGHRYTIRSLPFRLDEKTQFLAQHSLGPYRIITKEDMKRTHIAEIKAGDDVRHVEHGICRVTELRAYGTNVPPRYGIACMATGDGPSGLDFFEVQRHELVLLPVTELAEEEA